MTRMGRPPIPTAIKKTKGTLRQHRVKGEPQPDTAKPACPRWMTPYARAVWRYIAPILHRQGTLTMADRDLLVVYCESAALLREATEALEREGKLVVTKHGTSLQNPWLYTRKQAVQDMLKAGAELGIGAGSRTRISVKVEDDEPSLAEALFAAVDG